MTCCSFDGLCPQQSLFFMYNNGEEDGLYSCWAGKHNQRSPCVSCSSRRTGLVLQTGLLQREALLMFPVCPADGTVLLAF